MKELRLSDETIFLLDGPVVEIFSKRLRFEGGSHRWHVDHLGVDAKPQRDGGLKVELGSRDKDGALRFGNRITVDVEATDAPALLSFFEEAKAARGDSFG